MRRNLTGHSNFAGARAALAVARGPCGRPRPLRSPAALAVARDPDGCKVHAVPPNGPTIGAPVRFGRTGALGLSAERFAVHVPPCLQACCPRGWRPGPAPITAFTRSARSPSSCLRGGDRTRRRLVRVILCSGERAARCNQLQHQTAVRQLSRARSRKNLTRLKG
jgi:hypothetical protein